MMSKKLASAICLIVVLLLTLTACGTTAATTTAAASTTVAAETTAATTAAATTTAVPKVQTLEMVSSTPGAAFDAQSQLAAAFNKANPDIVIEISALGDNYESILKVKMASNDMPDIWGTHGWSKTRYDAFLTDLRDQPWVSRIKDTFKNMVTTADGKVEVLPIDMDVVGVVYNVDLCKKFGIPESQLATQDGFLAACDTIVKQSKGTIVPIHEAGGDPWPIGMFYNMEATPAFLTAEDNDQKACLDGTFDWAAKWTPLAQMVQDMTNKGYFNKDWLTAKYTDSVKNLAEQKSVFSWYGFPTVVDVHKLNPKVNLSFVPIPAWKAGDTGVWSGGERTAWGIWKDCKYPDAAKKYLTYLADPANVTIACESVQLMPALTGVDGNFGVDVAQYEKFKARTFDIFDRAFLPDGMWDSMMKGAQEMAMGQITALGYSQMLQKEYDRLRAAVAAAK